jgi:predicted porin
MFVDYKKDGASLILGKIPVKTPVTATGVGEAIAAGAVATYKVADSLTVAAAWLDDLVNTDKVGVAGKDTVAAAAIYNSDIADIQAWYFTVNDIIDSDIVLSADIKPVDTLTVHVDYAQADLDDSISKDTQTYLNLSATYKQDALCAKVGYAVTGKDGGIVVLDGDSPLASVLGTEQQTGIANTKDNNALYANVNYKLDEKTSVKAAYSAIDADSANEFLVGANYAYTKKFNVYAYYSIKSADSGDNNEARIELKYKF